MSLNRFYNALVAPRTAKSEDQSREVTLNILLIGTLGLALTAILVVLTNFSTEKSITLTRLGFCMIVTAFIALLLGLSRNGHYKVASYLFVLVYFLIVVGMVTTWSIQIPQGVLLAAFVIILSGILLGSRHALYAAGLNITALLTALFFTDPNTTWKEMPPAVGDVVVFGLTFGLIATVCWLYNSQIEKSLKRAERSEAALRRQKALLEIKVEERTQKLQKVQLEQIQQVYRFAELGQVSTALLHDLANHLTTIALDIEGLEEQTNSQILGRVKKTIRYIDGSVQNTRKQLHGETSAQKFAVDKALAEVFDILSYRAQQHDVRVEHNTGVIRPMYLSGDENRFKQMVTNIVGNGIDAYDQTTGKERVVVVETKAEKDQLHIIVSDQGPGISSHLQKHLFAPFYSTKKKGMGLGLFMAKEIAEKGFGGRITASSNKKRGTVFTISLPLTKP